MKSGKKPSAFAILISPMNTPSFPSTERITESLGEVMDPELHMSITDLGLVYKVAVENNSVTIRMTLTSLGCPLFDTIEEEIYHALGKINIPKEAVKIDLTFDPPWSMDLMSERAKAMLGI